MDWVTPCLMMALSTGRQSGLVMKSQLPGSLRGVEQAWPVREPREPKLKRVCRLGAAGRFFFRISVRDIRPFFSAPPGRENETELSTGRGLLEETGGLSVSGETEFLLKLI